MMEISRNNTLWPFIESFFEKKIAAQRDSYPWITRDTKQDKDE